MVDTNNNAKGGKRKSVKRKVGDTSVSAAPKKTRLTICRAHERGSGQLYTFGMNVCGQLGLEQTVNCRKNPSLVEELKDKRIVQVACGALHTLALDGDGNVYTFGVNDDSALGRKTEEEEDNFRAGQVDLRGKKVLQISAGDSHCAVLTEGGDVLAWGTFKDSNGTMGLLPGDENSGKCFLTPQRMAVHSKVMKISSGDNHLAMLTEDGKLFTCGCGEQGQLGRVTGEETSHSSQRRITRAKARADQRAFAAAASSPAANRSRDVQLTPTEVKVRKKINDVWCTAFGTFFRTEKSGEIQAFGLNNWGQLAFPIKDGEILVVDPKKSKNFEGMKIVQIAGGQHHSVALDAEGRVWTFGRPTDGRLGFRQLGTHNEDEPMPSLIQVPLLANIPCVQVAAGLSTTYALTTEGELYSWGCGVNYQLGTGSDENATEPTKLQYMVVDKKKVDLDRQVLYASAGSQHAAVCLS